MTTILAAIRSDLSIVSPALATGRVGADRAAVRGAADVATRALDIVIAIVAIAFFAPLLMLVAALVGLSGGPILFRQRRVGRNGDVFTCLKFRTMHANADAMLSGLLTSCSISRAEWERDRKLRVDPRIIRYGTFIRKASLDELPQLFNVLAGSMSIVGPRPIVPSESGKYGRYFGHYCRVRPGITGLWQISGRNHTTYRRRIACDVAYVRNKSSLRDAQIMVRTIPAVCFARGAY